MPAHEALKGRKPKTESYMEPNRPIFSGSVECHLSWSHLRAGGGIMTLSSPLVLLFPNTAHFLSEGDWRVTSGHPVLSLL